jgi:hypothetical protein
VLLVAVVQALCKQLLACRCITTQVTVTRAAAAQVETLVVAVVAALVVLVQQLRARRAALAAQA